MIDYLRGAALGVKIWGTVYLVLAAFDYGLQVGTGVVP